MKTKYLILFAALGCLMFVSCDWGDDCANNDFYHHPTRNPKLYNDNYMTLYDLNKEYLKVRDGDTLRLEGYYFQTNGVQGYKLALTPTQTDTSVQSKNHLFLDNNRLPIYPSDSIRTIFGMGYTNPLIPLDCYDTLKTKLCQVEGVIHFIQIDMPGECEEQCYLHVRNLKEQFDNI